MARGGPSLLLLLLLLLLLPGSLQPPWWLSPVRARESACDRCPPARNWASSGDSLGKQRAVLLLLPPAILVAQPRTRQGKRQPQMPACMRLSKLRSACYVQAAAGLLAASLWLSPARSRVESVAHSSLTPRRQLELHTAAGEWQGVGQLPWFHDTSLRAGSP